MIRNTLPKIHLSLIVGLTLTIGLQGVSKAVTVTAEEIKAKVVAHVQEKLGGTFTQADQEYLTVSIPRVPAAPFEFPEAETVRISTTSSLGEMYSERGVVKVSLKDQDGHYREIGVPIQLKVSKPVWVVKNIINANEPLRASDLVLQTRDVSHCYQYAIGQERNLRAYVARVNLRPGDVLDTRKIVIPPDVSYNSSIRILISNGDGLTLTVPGVAMDSGRVGEVIRVRQSVYQRKYYSAKIIDKNQVLVEI